MKGGKNIPLVIDSNDSMMNPKVKDYKTAEKNADLETFPGIVRGTVQTTGGIKLRTKVIPGRKNAKVMLLAPAIGFSMSIFKPILNHFQDSFTYISWDYRGMYESDEPGGNLEQSMDLHAEDSVQVLKSSGFEFADVLVGYSMGVQVCLETAFRYPEKCGILILINGTHGEALKTNIPIIGKPCNWMVDRALDFMLEEKRSYGHQFLSFMSSIASSPLSRKFLNKLSDFGENETWENIGGSEYLSKLIVDIGARLSKDEKSSKNYFRILKELKNHSLRNALDTIRTPTLLISSSIDFITPFSQMREMKERMPNAILVNDKWSAHYSLVLNPKLVIRSIEGFFAHHNLKVDKSPLDNDGSLCWRKERKEGEEEKETRKTSNAHHLKGLMIMLEEKG